MTLKNKLFCVWCLTGLMTLESLVNGLALTHAEEMSQKSQPLHNLSSCFRLAVQRSDSLANQTELINQAEERVRQAWAAFIPNLNASANYLQQQDPGTTLAKTIFPANQTTAKATLTQNLFKGLRDLASLKQRQAEKEASGFARDQAKIQLFQDTAQAFYNVLAYEYDLKNYHSEIEANQKRKSELQTLKHLARAREVDIVSIDSSIANLEASVLSTRGLLRSARETLAFLTGLSPDASFSDAEPLPSRLKSLEEFLDRVEKRPDIVQARESLNAAEQMIGVARAGHFPSADFNANYYFARAGIYEGINWDFQVSLVLPIFAGGSTQSMVREAASQSKGKELALNQSRKQAERDIRSTYAVVEADLDQVEKLSKATDLAKRKYELFVKDNHEGLASNVDVLQALATAYQTKRSYDHARLVTKSDFAKLQAITTERNLTLE